MTATTTATPQEVEARTRAALVAFDYSLRRFRQELLAEWRTPGLPHQFRPGDDRIAAPVDHALDRLERTLERIDADAGVRPEGCRICGHPPHTDRPFCDFGKGRGPEQCACSGAVPW